MAASVSQYDVVIIGGGISGLFTAWRLGTSTNLRVLLLEGSDRFGGKFMTCKMPGGFCADLAAMRYMPTCHKVLHALTEALDIKTKILVKEKDAKKDNKFNFYLRNQRLRGIEEIRKLYSFSDSDLAVFLAVYQLFFPEHKSPIALHMDNDGNFSKAFVGSTGQRAQDMTVGQYLLQTKNSELLNFGAGFYPPPYWRVDVAAGKINLLASHWHSARLVDGGMEEIVKALTKVLSAIPTIELRSNSAVLTISEDASGFVVNANDCLYKSKQIILACGKLALENMVVKSDLNREQVIRQLTATQRTLRYFKIFLTYCTPWWEDYGLFEGSISTDLPIHLAIAFGENGKTESHATMLASYSFTHVELFEGLDEPTNERFVNKEGDIREELVPSQLLVDYIQDQLCTLLGCLVIPEEPVCAVRMVWGTETTDGTSHFPKMGVDSNQVHWDSLKPFDDAKLYITGDVFPAWDKDGCHIGFSESALLTSERILVNHFNIGPITEGICLQNPWPKN